MTLTKEELLIISDVLISEIQSLAEVKNRTKTERTIRVIDELIDDVKIILSKINKQYDEVTIGN